MSITTVFFDLDGTLLPMEQETFVRTYLGLLCQKLKPLGYDPRLVSEALWQGTGAMVRNDGSRTNEAVFWQVFRSRLGDRVLTDKPHFDAFYREEFQQVAQVCGKNPAARRLVDRLLARGVRLVLATNPLFPAQATCSRIRWAGLEPEAFALITTYENSSCCKPNPDYYREILARLSLKPEECLMVGNDALEDLAARQAGLPVFLLTDCLIAPQGVDLSRVPQGDFAALSRWLEQQLAQ